MAYLLSRRLVADTTRSDSYYYVAVLRQYHSPYSKCRKLRNMDPHEKGRLPPRQKIMSGHREAASFPMARVPGYLFHDDRCHHRGMNFTVVGIGPRLGEGKAERVAR